MIFHQDGGRFFSIIDIGSNSIKMSMASITNKSYSILIEEKEALRLLQADEVEISSEKIDQLIRILKHFGDLARGYGSEIKIVATSAMRRAKNRDQVCQKIYRETNLNIEIITGEDEASYILEATKNRFDLKKGAYWIVDIGGGSLEVVFLKNQKALQKVSMSMGAVVIKDQYFLNEIKIKDFKNIVHELASRIQNKVSFEKSDDIIVSGGNPAAVAKIIQVRREEFDEHLHGTSIKEGELEQLCEKLIENGHQKVVHRYGVSKNRADLVLPCLAVLLAFLKFASEKKYLVSRTGLREGIIGAEFKKSKAA